MLPLRKKSNPAAAAAPVLPPWHPDIRLADRLPDTKVVRTAFFVNGAAIVAVLALLLWFSVDVYQWRALVQQAADWEEQIARNEPVSKNAVALHKKYQTEAARINELSAFSKTRVVPSECLLRVAATLPAFLALDRLDVREGSVTLQGTVRGAPDQASGNASAYLELLKKDAYFADRFSEIKLASVNRSPQTGRLTVEIVLKVKP